MYTGWLFDLYEDPLGGLVVWFIGEDGARRRLRQRFPMVFYALGPANRLQLLEKFLNQQPVPVRMWQDQRMDVFARGLVAALAVEVARPAELTPLFRQVTQQFPDLDYADADLQLSLRYAAATGVSPLCRCQLEVDEQGMIQAAHPLEDPWALDPSNLPLRVLSLEPDCNPAHRTPRFLLAQAGEQAYRFALKPVRALLVNLQSLLVNYDPDLLLTTWGDTWLLPRLLEMSEKFGLPLALNRDPAAVIARRKERWYFSYGQVVYRGEQVLLYGRWHVDRKNAMMWSDYELDGVLETARVTSLPLQTASRVSPGTGISSIQMLAALRQKILVPWQKQQAEQFRPALSLFASDQGGLVYQPTVGIHRDVAEVDFVSMYPAIMVNYNISPETIGHPGPQAEWVPGINLFIDHSLVGLVPLALKPLLDKRVSLKQRLGHLAAWDPRRARDKKRASALKWLLVTCFGYLGYKNARFGRIEAHQAVTAYGRELLLRAKEVAEAQGYEILHLYVDGMWVKRAGQPTGKAQPEDVQPMLDEIYARTGLPILLDGIFRWVVFLPSRVNEERAVANRYFGVFQDGTLKARGIAARRRDTPAFIAKVQMGLLELLARPEEPCDALPDAALMLHKRLAELRERRVPLDQLLLGQRLSRDVDAYRTPSPSARAALQLQQAGKEVKPGQRVRFVFTYGKPGVYAWDLPVPPDPAAVDVSRYCELLLRAAQEVLGPFLGSSNREQPSLLPPALPFHAIIEQ